MPQPEVPVTWPVADTLVTTRVPSIDVLITGPVAVMFANLDPILPISSPKNPPVNDAV
jgi:hypothetical protein